MKGHWITNVLIILVFMSSTSIVHSGIPLWKITPLTPTSFTLPINSTALVKYRVTNQSKRAHVITMKPIPGITQMTTAGNCSERFVLSYQQSCILSLYIDGSALDENVTGGPILYQQNNPLQSYQPSEQDSLKINIGAAVYFSISGTITGLQGTLVLANSNGETLTLSKDGAFAYSKLLPPGGAYSVTVISQPATQTCTVSNGSGTIGGANVTNVQVLCVNNPTTLSISTSELALSVKGYTENGVTGTPSSGVARSIRITNVGSETALDLSINLPQFPTGTTSSTTCGSTLAVAATCTITIDPGNTATSDGTNPCSDGTVPIADVVQVSSSNANTVSTNVFVLDYVCIYQGGYVYAFDDTTATDSSVGRKVFSTSNQSSSMVWNNVWISLWGIDDTSTSSSPSPNNSSATQYSGQNSCDGELDGACNTNNIYIYYQYNYGATPMPIDTYAAGICKQPIAGYTDWYLPAIGEMGPASTAVGCGSPVTQSIYCNLYKLVGDISTPCPLGANCFFGYYWTSTEDSTNPHNNAWYVHMVPLTSNYYTNIHNKSSTPIVRCSRALTP